MWALMACGGGAPWYTVPEEPQPMTDVIARSLWAPPGVSSVSPRSSSCSVRTASVTPSRIARTLASALGPSHAPGLVPQTCVLTTPDAVDRCPAGLAGPVAVWPEVLAVSPPPRSGPPMTNADGPAPPPYRPCEKKVRWPEEAKLSEWAPKAPIGNSASCSESDSALPGPPT